MFHLALLTGNNREELDVLSAKVARNPDDIPRITYHWWQSWMRDTLDVTADDPRLGDLVDDTKVLIAVQQSPTGSIAPLAQRSQSHAAEELAPLRWLLASGKTDAVRDALEYRYQEICRQGRYAGGLPETSPAADLPTREPVWEELTPPPAWTAASIMRAHAEYWRQTGDLAFMRAHFRYLRWLGEAQALSPEYLVPFGGDEPFYTAFQRSLPLEAQERLLPVAHPYALMRNAPWGAAPAMALAAGLNWLVSLAAALGEDESAQRLGVLASQIREAVERTYWLDDEGYYAAARSRVDGSLYRLPHLPTALAAFSSGYADLADPRARQGLDETLQYTLDTTGLPLTTPYVTAFPGYLPGELLTVLSRLNDYRVDQVLLAMLSCVAAGGDMRSHYVSVDRPILPDGLARPFESATAALAVLDFLLGAQPMEAGVSFTVHMPPASDHLHLAGIHVAQHRIDLTATRQGDAVQVTVSNAGEHDVHARLQDRSGVATASYVLHAAEQRAWTLSETRQAPDSLPSPREYLAQPRRLAPAPLLILTIDADSFVDWQEQFAAIVLDAGMPIAPEGLAQLLQHDHRRRYDLLYLDLPEVGAAWAGIAESFWGNADLQQALDDFRDLGGHVASTLFVDSWRVQLAERDPYEIATQHGWITLPHIPGVVSATSTVPWESAHDDDVELLLYAADGTDLEIWVNGQRLWRRGQAPEGRRIRIDAVLHAGDNELGIRAERRAGFGFGFCLGIRGKVSRS
jgi:hypothetical protein